LTPLRLRRADHRPAKLRNVASANSPPPLEFELPLSLPLVLLVPLAEPLVLAVPLSVLLPDVPLVPWLADPLFWPWLAEEPDEFWSCPILLPEPLDPVLPWDAELPDWLLPEAEPLPDPLPL